MAIGANAYKLLVDATKFAEGTALSRKELQFLRTTLKETATDADKYAAGLDVLNKSYKAGALNASQYSRSLKSLEAETAVPAQAIDPVASAGKKGGGMFGGIIPTIDVGNLAIRTMAIGWQATKRAIREVNQEIAENLKEIGKAEEAATKFGNAMALTDIPENMREAASHLEKFGGSLTNLDLAKFREFDAASSELKKTFGDLARSFTADLTPGMTEFARGLTDAFSKQETKEGLKLLAMIAHGVGGVGGELAGKIPSMAKGASDFIPDWMEKLAFGNTINDTMKAYAQVDNLNAFNADIAQAKRVNDERFKGIAMGRITSAEQMEKSVNDIREKNFQETAMRRRMAGDPEAMGRELAADIREKNFRELAMSRIHDAEKKERAAQSVQSTRDVDISTVGRGSREHAMLVARGQAGAFGAPKATEEEKKSLAVLREIAAKIGPTAIEVHEVTL